MRAVGRRRGGARPLLRPVAALPRPNNGSAASSDASSSPGASPASTTKVAARAAAGGRGGVSPSTTTTTTTAPATTAPIAGLRRSSSSSSSLSSLALTTQRSVADSVVDVAAAPAGAADDAVASTSGGSATTGSASSGGGDAAALGAWWDALPARYRVLVGAFASFVICNMDKVNMSVAIIPMAQDFGWSPSVAGLVQSAFFWGYILSQLPGGYLTSRLGGRRTLPAGVTMWSAATAAVPLLAGTVPGLCLSRAAVGLGEAVAPSAATDMASRIVPPEERSRAVSFVFAGLHVGSIAGLLAAPWLISHLGWPSVFVAFGGAGLAWTLWFEALMARIAADEPETAALLTADRLAATAHAPAGEAVAVADPHAAAPLPAGHVPWRAFLRSRGVRALMYTHFW